MADTSQSRGVHSHDGGDIELFSDSLTSVPRRNLLDTDDTEDGPRRPAILGVQRCRIS
jgi:hypothetical protein